jgi:S1-C subfamily serine protease
MSTKLSFNTPRLATAIVLGIFALILLISTSSVTLASINTPTFMLDSPQFQTGETFTEIYDRVSPSVVAISVAARRPGTNRFGNEDDETVFGSGSGFVIDKEGHIVTNNHVVEGATRIEINFFDGTLTRAEIIGLDPDSDLAVLKVDLPAEKLQPIAFGDSDELAIGQTVLAIGSPFGQRWTLTSGIISALDRTIRGLENFSTGGVIQTDAAINPGNSGGPLLDLEGRVIGVNSQIISNSRSNSGIGFAIPSKLTQRVTQELIENGFVNYSYLGISGGNVQLSIIEALELPNDLRGVVVSEALPGEPAARAGIQSASNWVEVDGMRVPQSVDIITDINGEPLTSFADLLAYLNKNTKPGDTITLSVLRNGQEELELETKLIPRP